MIIHRRRLVAEAILVAASLMVATGGTPAYASSPQPVDLDLVASARPAPPQTSDTDLATAFVRTRGQRVKADTVATASSSCDTCTASATAVHVIYLGKTRSASLHNTATAWSTCRDCSATAVSVQLVVTRPDTSLTARNDALAVNAACDRCATAAAAYQLIVVTKDHRALSRDGRARLQALALQLASELRPTGPSNAARVARAERLGGPRLEALVKGELRPMTVRRHLIVTTG
jgi:hypothetical protein